MKTKKIYAVTLDGKDFYFDACAEEATKFYEHAVKWYGMSRVRIKIIEEAAWNYSGSWLLVTAENW